MYWTARGKPTPEAIGQLETQQVPVRLRVTLLSGERITYKSARVVGDSLRYAYNQKSGRWVKSYTLWGV